MNYTDIDTACTVVNGTFQGQCTYVYGTDYVLTLLTIIAIWITFIVIYILYKEAFSGKI